MYYILQLSRKPDRENENEKVKQNLSEVKLHTFALLQPNSSSLRNALWLWVESPYTSFFQYVWPLITQQFGVLVSVN